ncbi:hypothetical protein [Shewanella sp. NIFS-20-20]|uniref:hypothetical protein n=1 Tax=Shewanella sp. NIFS-20-20 TaxID=2853806 RepID=UPI001C46D762|nr:hypothetical protein [Shewanella sp. NIFS-20-20]MBV7314304.1 hypothetical protein [Shewanella sp. NIFS-20-20]
MITTKYLGRVNLWQRLFNRHCAAIEVAIEQWLEWGKLDASTDQQRCRVIREMRSSLAALLAPPSAPAHRALPVPLAHLTQPSRVLIVQPFSRDFIATLSQWLTHTDHQLWMVRPSENSAQLIELLAQTRLKLATKEQLPREIANSGQPLVVFSCPEFHEPKLSQCLTLTLAQHSYSFSLFEAMLATQLGLSVYTPSRQHQHRCLDAKLINDIGAAAYFQRAQQAVLQQMQEWINHGSHQFWDHAGINQLRKDQFIKRSLGRVLRLEGIIHQLDDRRDGKKLWQLKQSLAELKARLQQPSEVR